MEENKEKKYQAATYIKEEMPVREVRKIRKQSKIVRILVAIPITLVILLIVTIIGYFIYRDVTGPRLDKMLEYMEEKYGETFEVVATDTQAWSSPYTEIKLRSEKFPNEIITEITYRRNGKRIYKDSYVEILRRDEFNVAYQELVSKVYNESRVFVYGVFGGVTLPAEIGKDTPVNDILSHPHVNTGINIYVEADSDKKDKQLNDLRLELKKRKWGTAVHVYYMQKGIVEQLTMENQNEILNEQDSCYLYGYTMISNDDFKIKEVEWRDYSE